MFVPIARVPFETIINKNIVYSDTILKLNEVGTNLKITTIDNISEFELEDCLKILFNSNKDTLFNTVQYSKNDKKLIIYADKNIELKEWQKSKTFKYNPITNKKEILEELNSILNYKKTKDPNITSLYTVHQILNEKNITFQNEKNTYEKLIDNKLKELYSDSAYCVLYDFNYDNNIMTIGFKEYDWDEICDIRFSKKDGDLYIINSKSSLYANEHLVESGKELSKLFDIFIKYKKYNEETKNNIIGTNTNFKIDISSNSIKVYTNTSEFSISNFIPNEFEYDCNSLEIIEFIKDREKVLYENIFINISDCPNWMQEDLKILRYNELVYEFEKEKELEEIRRINEIERILKERKKEKKLALKRKLLPWIK